MNIVKSLFQSSIGRKYIMAVTGGLLFGFLVVHLAGNVQIFLGADRINSYAALLKSNLLVLWGFRLGLAAIALIHITTATGLTLENWAARPDRYAANTDPYASFSARTMVVSGVILFAFITYHLLHFTLGVTQPGIMHHVDHLGRHDVYRMMLEGFRNPWIAGTYLAAGAITGGDVTVTRARARDLEALQARSQPGLQRAPQALGHLAWRRSQARSQQQSGVGGVVAKLRAPRALQRDRRPVRAPCRGSRARGPPRTVAWRVGALCGELFRGVQNRPAKAVQRRRGSVRADARGAVGIVGGKLCHGSVVGACDTSYVNDQDSGAERHINIHLSPEIMGGVYANFANVSHSDYEFTVTFARVDHEVESDEVPGVVVSRVNLSPRFMRELIDAMEDNYSKWRTREGIKNLPEYGGSEGASEPE